MIDAKDGDGKTPLHLALESGMYSKVEALLEEFNAGMYIYSCRLHKIFREKCKQRFMGYVTH